MKNIFKYFDSFCALKNININIKKGSIHALLGENGAGKSTLMNILYGFYHADNGEIFINQKKVNIKNPNIAIKLGIGMVHQHFMLVQPFSVLQNIILGREPVNKLGILNINQTRKKIEELSKKYGLAVDLDAKIEDISVGMQQKVEILKALYRGSDILIFDEPTAVLASQEIDELILTMKNLTDHGKTIIIITHKLKEIKKAANYCTVIRKGEYIDTVCVKDTTEDELAQMMVGRNISLHINKAPAKPKEEILSIENIVVKDSRGFNKIKNLSLSVKRGEILGIAGIEGNGQKELVDAITNLTKTEKGKIKINNKEIQNTSPKNVINNKISTIPEDRHKRGLILDFSVAENIILINYNNSLFSNKGFLNIKNINKFSDEIIREFDVRPTHCKKLPIRALSGGNQQKVVIGREVSNDPELLIAVQPTRGLDVGAIEYVHQTLVKQRDKGRAILLVSLELDEIIDLSDRIAVIYDGQIVDIIDSKDANENKISLLMAGGNKK
ncbi:MAG: ABC transporter ATP-binding protein [Oscillospiraceae bacterium]|nr:ABC transporter ATP-binding protein [Oscillospiraceae bacterium]